jgi:RHS repeat-associated protein
MHELIEQRLLSKDSRSAQEGALLAVGLIERRRCGSSLIAAEILGDFSPTDQDLAQTKQALLSTWKQHASTPAGATIVWALGRLCTYQYDNNDRLSQENATPGGATAYSYDANGNTTAKFVEGVVIDYAYDDANRLKEERSGANRTTYAYNADGLRISQTAIPATGSQIKTEYLVDPSYAYANVVERFSKVGSAQPTLSAVYTFGEGIVAQTTFDAGAATERFIQSDGFGSTRFLTNTAGTITDKLDYDAFGNELNREGDANVEHLYRGEQFDANLGWYYLRARYMDPSQGRFVTMDPFSGITQDPVSLHRYLYAHSNPVNGIDPSGYLTLTELSITMTVGGVVNAAIGVGLNALSPTSQSIWGDVGRDFVVGAAFAPAGGIVAQVFGPVLKGLAAPVLRAVARVKPLVLTGRRGWERLMISMSRTLFRTTKGYPSVQSTLIGQALRFVFPNVKWEQHHIFIQQASSRGGSASQVYTDVLANEGLRRIGNGGWNLMPIPRSLNGWLGQPGNEVATQVFATFIYSVAVFGPMQLFDSIENTASESNQP